MRDLCILKEGTIGETTNSDDIWIGSKPLKLLFPRIYALDNIKDASICMKLNEPSLDNNFRRSIRGGIEHLRFKKLYGTYAQTDRCINPCPDRFSPRFTNFLSKVHVRSGVPIKFANCSVVDAMLECGIKQGASVKVNHYRFIDTGSAEDDGLWSFKSNQSNLDDNIKIVELGECDLIKVKDTSSVALVKVKEVPQSEGSIPPGFEKEHIINDVAPSREGKKGDASMDPVKNEHTVTHDDKLSDEMIKVGGALGYDVKGCKKSLRQMINGIGGLVTMWDPNVFVKKRIWCGDNYIIVEEGVWITDPKAIKVAFLNFYKDRFSCHNSLVSFTFMLPANWLSIHDRDSLEVMVSLDEIKMAVWDCGSQKAPDPNGYSFMFIKRFWELLKHDIHTFVDLELNGVLGLKLGLYMTFHDGLAANMFHGVKVGTPGIHLSYLFYADNVVILFEWNQTDM
ncbi:hypothetical protein Tco_1531247 [Tanacetum coccineum]